MFHEMCFTGEFEAKCAKYNKTLISLLLLFCIGGELLFFLGLECYFCCFQVIVGKAVFVYQFVAAGDGDVFAGVWEVGRVVVVSWPDELEALLAAGGGVWDYYCVIEFCGLRVCVCFKPAFYFDDSFFVFFWHD